MFMFVPRQRQCLWVSIVVNEHRLERAIGGPAVGSVPSPKLSCGSCQHLLACNRHALVKGATLQCKVMQSKAVSPVFLLVALAYDHG
jgi:hypothetical protein